jgi:CRP/FNR family transcriptional regulator, anaerobic regulatory protein
MMFVNDTGSLDPANKSRDAGNNLMNCQHALSNIYIEVLYEDSNMIDDDKNQPTCEHCTFSPFCIAEEKSLDWINQNNHAVKQHHLLKKNETLYLPQSMFRNLYAIQRGNLKTYQVDANGMN